MKELQKRLNATFGCSWPKRADSQRKTRDAARRLAAAIGIEIEVIPGRGYMVWPPVGLSGCDDPFIGDHEADSWDTVLNMVQAYDQVKP